MPQLSLKYYSGLIISLICWSCSPNLSVSSPDGQHKLSFSLDEKGRLSYTVLSGETTLITPSLLGIQTTEQQTTFTEGLTFTSSSSVVVDETYTLPTGKCSLYRNHANEKTFVFTNPSGGQIHLISRAYNDGVAFRYRIDSPGKLTLEKELTTFSVPSGTSTWMMDWKKDYENFYPKRLIEELPHQELLYPALMQIGNNWLLLTEAAVYDQPATHLVKDNQDNRFSVAFARENPTFSVEKQYLSPWRTFLLGNQLGEIVESVLVENLNPPTEIVDQSWISPGVAVFPWWGNYLANSYIDTLKQYIDLAAEMKWEWLEFDISLINTPFHSSRDWENVDWIPEVTAYAHSKGIKVYGWDEIKILDNEKGRNFVFDRYKAMGVDGIKIDYIDSDAQYAMKFRDTACAVAAQKKLLVSFHGETVPRGHRRRYPNIMTNEGVRGAEYYTFKGDRCPTPRHNCTLPFTRNVIGPMDYTPVTFTIREENPRTTTYVHELALAFIFESGWVCMADRPAAYLNSPARPLLEKAEASWDETRFIEGYPGEYICLARRKGNNWYLAAINSDSPRTVSIPLNFLPEGTYHFDLYEDHPEKPLTQINIRKVSYQSGDTLKALLRPEGGFATFIAGQS